jgi:hypothetical protein
MRVMKVSMNRILLLSFAVPFSAFLYLYYLASLTTSTTALSSGASDVTTSTKYPCETTVEERNPSPDATNVRCSEGDTAERLDSPSYCLLTQKGKKDLPGEGDAESRSGCDVSTSSNSTTATIGESTSFSLVEGANSIVGAAFVGPVRWPRSARS